VPNVIDADEYARFVAALPRQYEADLVTTSSVSTGYFKARQMGWDEDVLTAEAIRTLDTGGRIGAVVERFRMLATIRPSIRSGDQRPERVPYKRPSTEPIPFEWYQERMGLIRRIQKGGWTVDAAEREMQALMDRQNASRDVDPFK
jgi:hypothetical protein